MTKLHYHLTNMSLGRFKKSDKKKCDLDIKDIEKFKLESTAKESVINFFTELEKRFKLGNINTKLMMSGVGLTCDGRGSCYDLIYYGEGMLYTIDKRDYNYVCELKCKI